MSLIPFPSIKQFRDVVKHIKDTTYYNGVDNEGNAIYDYNRALPVLKFHGAVKLHGTNAAICRGIYNKFNKRRIYNECRIWYQSRNNIITPNNDNMGFAAYCETKLKHNIDMLFHVIGGANVQVYGDWCGEGIQKNVAISKLSKRFVIVAINKDGVWYNRRNLSDVCRISNIYNVNIDNVSIDCIENYETYDIIIYFSHTEKAQNELVRITNEVEEKCPVASKLGVDGVGEGVVWYCVDDGYNDSSFWFKVKGEKHSVSKVKSLAGVDIEKVNSVKEFVAFVCTENRMLQGIDYLREQNLDVDVKNTGVFLKWLVNDCIKEESDTMTESNLDIKDVSKVISDNGRVWFFKQLGL